MKKTMLILGLVLIGQGQASPLPQPPSQVYGNNPATWGPPISTPTSQNRITLIVNRIMNNQEVPEWYAVSSITELNKIRDELFLKNAGANEFLRTPVKATEKEENYILSVLKSYKKRYSPERYKAIVINIMKYITPQDLLLRPLYFQMSGLTMSDLAEAEVNFTTYRLSVKDRALFKRTRSTIFKNLNNDYTQFQNKLPF